MAQIVQQTFMIVVSRLVKDNSQEPACTEEQTQIMLETLPGVVEQILDSSSAVVEVSTES